MENEKIKKVAESFLNSWIENKSFELNKLSIMTNIESNEKRTFFKRVLLHSYKILSCTMLSDTKAEMKVQMKMAIREKTRDKRLMLSVVKVKNEWKIDLGPLIAH
jgi:hypothetical protein